MVRRLLLTLLLSLVLAGQAGADGCPSPGQGLVPFAFEELTVSTVAVSLTALTIQSATTVAAFVTLTGGSISYTFTGVPTATVGHLFDPPSGGNAGSTSGYWVCGKALLLGFRAIRQGGTDAKLHVTYFSN